MKTVGERIRQAREYRRISAEALAKEVGYSTQSGISNLENRSVGRGGFRLPDIARALDFSLTWFLDGPDVSNMAEVPSFAADKIAAHGVEEPRGKYFTTRQHAHHLVDQLSDLGIDKAISMLELIAAAHPKSGEDCAGLPVPARIRRAR